MKSLETNVLISCVGRQSFLVKQFQRALRGEGRVVATDHDPLASGIYAANVSHTAPRFDSDAYGEWMVSLCKDESISLLISLLPEELLVLENCRSSLEAVGTKLVGMPPKWIVRCLNKNQHDLLCQGTSFKTPPHWSFEKFSQIPADAYPLLAKEVDGKGSRGMFRLENANEVAKLIATLGMEKCVTRYVLQSFLTGVEYGLDLVNDLDGQHRATFVRRKLRMSFGETEIAETVADDRLEQAGRVLANQLGHQGVVDCDVLRCDGEDYLLDVNSRFGGGYVFSHCAGADVPAALVAWARGEAIDPLWLQPRQGIIAARTSRIERLKPKGETIGIITTGNHEIGMGHATRQLSIAEAATKAGHRPVIFTDSMLVAKHAEQNKIEKVMVSFEDADQFRQLLDAHGPRTVVIDVHERDFNQFRWVAQHFPTLLSVSRVGCDFELFGKSAVFVGEDLAFWNAERIVRSQGGETTHVHSGRAFMLFRDEFRDCFALNAESRPSRVLIAHGGSDPYRLTERCMKALEGTQRAYDVQVLVGTAFKPDHVQALRQIATSSKHRYELLFEKNEVAEYMANAAIALINGGNIRYELCRTGTPFVALSFQESQYACTAKLAELGAGVNLGTMTEVSDQQIAIAVDELISNVTLRSKMKDTMLSLFDSDGCHRVVGLAIQQNYIRRDKL